MHSYQVYTILRRWSAKYKAAAVSGVSAGGGAAIDQAVLKLLVISTHPHLKPLHILGAFI